MRTLIISSHYPDISIGGIERYIKNFINYCYQKNKEVIFVLPAIGEESTEKRGKVTIYKKNFLYLAQEKVTNKKYKNRENELKIKSTNFFSFLNELFGKEQI